MPNLTIPQARKAYTEQLAEVEVALEAANQRVEAGERALRVATRAVAKTGGVMPVLNESESWREADQALQAALSARSRLDVRRTALKERMRALDRM